MANAILAALVCPLCGNDQATVHAQETGTKKGRVYFRCYQTRGGVVMRCGTIQPMGPEGQRWIREHMRPIGQPAAIAPEARPIGQAPAEPAASDDRPIAPPAPKPEHKPNQARGGFLSSLAKVLSEE